MDEVDRMARRYAVVVTPDPDGGGFLAEAPDFPAVCAGGDSPGEALDCAYDGIATIIDDMLRDGETVPEPSVAHAVP